MDKKDSPRELKEATYIYLYMVVIFSLILALTSLYYGLRIYSQSKLLQKELSRVRQEKSNLEKRLEIFSKEKDTSTIVLLEELLARIEEERTLLEEQVVKIKQECISLQEQSANIRESIETIREDLPQEIPYKVEFMDVAEIGGLYAELLSFGIKDGSFIGQIRNNWANCDFLFIDFEILIEFYNPVEGVNFTCQPFRLKVQNQTTREFLYKPETEWTITPQNIKDVRIIIKQLLSEKLTKEPIEELEEEPEEETEETLVP